MHEKRNPTSTRVFAACFVSSCLSSLSRCPRSRPRAGNTSGCEPTCAPRRGRTSFVRVFIRRAAWHEKNGLRQKHSTSPNRPHFEFNRDRVRKRSRSRMTERKREGEGGGGKQRRNNTGFSPLYRSTMRCYKKKNVGLPPGGFLF